MKNKPVLIFSTLALAAGLGGWWWSHASGADAAEPAADAPVALVQTTVLAERPIAETIEAFGLVVPTASGERSVIAPYDCVVKTVFVATGSPVAAGDVLAELAPSPEARLEFESAQGALKLAERGLAAAQERFDLKIANVTELVTAQQAEQEVRLKLASLEARGLGGDGRVLAPFAGIVGKVDAMSGAPLASRASLLALVAKDAGLEARLGVEPAAVDRVRAEQLVALVSLDRPGRAAVAGRVLVTGATIQSEGGEVAVRVALPEGADFLAGEHLRAAIEVDRHTALAAPRAAVLPDGEERVLFTVVNGHAVRHAVSVGIADAEAVEVSGGGVVAGDVAVTSGNYELSEGLAVRTATEATP